MYPGGLSERTPERKKAAGGSELCLPAQEGLSGPSGAGIPGTGLKSHESEHHSPNLTPSPRNHIRTTINGVRASNKFVAASWSDLQKDPDWYRVNYNRAIATWLRQCARSHDEICNCGRWRSHWFQEASDLVTTEAQTDPLTTDLNRLRASYIRAKRKLDYWKRKPKKPKAVTWLDTVVDQEDDLDTISEDDGTGDTDCDEDVIPGGVNFDVRADDPLLGRLLGNSSTRIPDHMW